MKVATDPAFLQTVIDAQRYWLAQDDDPDIPLSALFDTGVCLENEHGGFLFFPRGEGIWEVHTIFNPTVRDALGHAREAVAHMFGRDDCTVITTFVPADNIPAGRLTVAIGGQYIGTKPGAFLRDGVRHDVHHYALSKDAWAQATEGR
jgi:hypothetical protein